MKLIPRTLLGRTTLSLGLLLVAGQLLWLGATFYLFVGPLRITYMQQLRDEVVMAQALTESRLKQASPDSAGMLPLTSLRVVGDSAPRPDFETGPDPRYVSDLKGMLQPAFGSALRVETQKSTGVLWIRFPVGNSFFWLVLPFSRPPNLPVVLLMWAAIWLLIAIFGAYLILFHLTRQLRKVTAAAQAVGRAESGAPLPERGPKEIRDLSSAFNQMAVNLRRLDADRRLMLAGISHDLRTPLTRMRLEIELLGAETAAGMICDIEDMDAILSQFLDYARDGSEEKPTVGDLNAVVAEVCGGYRLRGNPIELELDNLPAFTFRRQGVRRIVANLVDNAVRYGRQEVKVATWLRGGCAVIVVADQGPGISESLPEILKRPFVRQDVSRSISGSGLGLAIVDRMVGLHGGTWKFANGSEGGLIVSVELPWQPLDGRT